MSHVFLPRAGRAGIHCNTESSNHHQAPSPWQSQWGYLPRPPKREGRGRGKLPHKSMIWSSKQLHDLPQQVCVIWSLAKPCMSNRGAWSMIACVAGGIVEVENGVGRCELLRARKLECLLLWIQLRTANRSKANEGIITPQAKNSLAECQFSI